MITKRLRAVSILPEKPWRGRSAAKKHDPPRKHLVSVLSHRWTTSFVWLINLCICLNYTGSFAVLSRGSFNGVSILRGENGENVLKKACPSLDLIRKHYQANRRTSQCFS